MYHNYENHTPIPLTEAEHRRDQAVATLNDITRGTCEFHYDAAANQVTTTGYVRGPVAYAIRDALNSIVRGDNGEAVTTEGNGSVNKFAKTNLLNMEFAINIPADMMSYQGLPQQLVQQSGTIRSAIDDGMNMAENIRKSEAALPKVGSFDR